MAVHGREGLGYDMSFQGCRMASTVRLKECVKPLGYVRAYLVNVALMRAGKFNSSPGEFQGDVLTVHEPLRGAMAVPTNCIISHDCAN